NNEGAQEKPGNILRAAANAERIADRDQHIVRTHEEEEVGEGPHQRLAFPRFHIDDFLDERFHPASISAKARGVPLFGRPPEAHALFRQVNPAADTAHARRWLVLAIAASGLFLICVDLTVLYVALPALTRDLAASNAE